MQLFTHLLSSYLQGMGDFFSALPKGRESLLAVFKDVWWRSFPLERGFLGFSLVCTYATICIYDVV